MQVVILCKVLGLLFFIISLTYCQKKKGNCGTKLDSKQSNNARIFGGKDAPKQKYPWYIDIVVEFDGNKNIKKKEKPTKCGGTLISKEYVLTAGHCFFDMNNEDKVMIKNGKFLTTFLYFTKIKMRHKCEI